MENSSQLVRGPDVFWIAGDNHGYPVIRTGTSGAFLESVPTTGICLSKRVSAYACSSSIRVGGIQKLGDSKERKEWKRK
jgi:hypothetical protein